MESKVPRILTLNENGYVQHNSIVRVNLGTNLTIVVHQGTPVSLLKLYTNYPIDKDAQAFDRNLFEELEPCNKELNGYESDWTIQFKIHCTIPGAFQFKFGKDPQSASAGARFVVEPFYIVHGQKLPSSGLTMQTVYGNCLGPVEQWLPANPPDLRTDPTKHVEECALQSTIEAGYNMIHFAPLCELGISGSAYCLRNQLALEPTCFGSCPPAEQFQKLETVLNRLESEYGVLSLVDLILNHTALDTPWVVDHPEATYNLNNSPHLRMAYEVDRALITMSLCIASQNHTDFPPIYPPSLATTKKPDPIVHAKLPPVHFKSRADIEILRTYMKEEIVHYRLWEYRVIDVEDSVKAFRQAIPRGRQPGNQSYFSTHDLDQFISKECIIIDPPQGRWSHLINIKKALQHMMPLAMNDEKLVAEFEASLNRVNLPFFKMYDDDIKSIITNSCNLVYYERIDESGPKRGAITTRSNLIYPYFGHIKAPGGWEDVDYLEYLQQYSLHRPHIHSPSSRLTQQFQNDVTLADTPPDAHSPTVDPLRAKFLGIPAVCNGWIMGGNPTDDFASPYSNAYVRREVVIWGDNFKLRYGDKPEDSPFLWNIMKEYTEWSARLFHGIRLDNAHSTPIHVSEYMLDCARRINPNVFMFAELFTNSEDTDVDYCSRLGVSAILREAFNRGSAGDLGSEIYNSGGDGIASLHSGNGEITWVKGRGLKLALSDITHDNRMLLETRGPFSALPLAAAVAASPTPILTTKGMDEMYPHRINTNTKKLYCIPPTLRSLPKKGNVPSIRGILDARRVLSRLHGTLAAMGYSELYVNVDQMTGIISVVRSHPLTHRGYTFIIHTVFDQGHRAKMKLPKPQTSHPNPRDDWIDQIMQCKASPSHPVLLPLGDAQEKWAYDCEISGVVRHLELFSYVVDAAPSHKQTQPEQPEKEKTKTETEADNSLSSAQSTAAAGNRSKTPQLALDEENQNHGIYTQSVTIAHTSEEDAQIAKDLADAGVSITANPDQIRNPHQNTHIHFTHFPPGAVCVFATDLPQMTRMALKQLQPTVHSAITALEHQKSSYNATPKSLLRSASSGILQTFPDMKQINEMEEEEKEQVNVLFALKPKSLFTPVCTNHDEPMSVAPDGCFRIDELAPVFETLTLLDFQWMLFSCDEEEKDFTSGKRGTYGLDGVGQIVYAGFAGPAILLERIANTNDLGHPLLDNLRKGNWLIDFLMDRLKEEEDTPRGGNGRTRKERFAPLVRLLEPKFNLIKNALPRYLVPRYFDEIVRPLVRFSISWIINKLMPGIHPLLAQSTLARKLMMSSVQLIASLPHTPFLELAHRIDDQKSQHTLLFKNIAKQSLAWVDKTRTEPNANELFYPTLPNSISPSFSAGLPFFSHGFMRTWGRDAMIAVRGLLLHTNRLAEATYLIRGFGSVMRHGLIPNLMGGGDSPRYNSRDAVWWWGVSVEDMCTTLLKSNTVHFPVVRKKDGKLWMFEAKRGGGEWREIDAFPFDLEAVKQFLLQPFPRAFDGFSLPDDVPTPQPPYPSSTKARGDTCLLSLLEEAIHAHGYGIHFRELNAGTKIDEKMQSEGFNIDIAFDGNTGFLFGGNKLNCGTWCDKMGDSAKAGNRGIPATPRDGCPVEIIGMLKSSLRFLTTLQTLGIAAEQPVVVSDYSHTLKQRFNRQPIKSVAPNTPSFDFLKVRDYSIPDRDFKPELFALTYEEWDEMIEENFDRYYYIPTEDEMRQTREKSDAPILRQRQFVFDMHTEDVTTRGHFKDVLGCHTDSWDYQLRPNQCIAMTSAPELFIPNINTPNHPTTPSPLVALRAQHVHNALDVINDVLKTDHSIGIATLDPSDWNYRPYYDQADTHDFATSAGFCYHNGPEWVWPAGYFFRALIIHNHLPSKPRALSDNPDFVLNKVGLYTIKQEIDRNPWLSLPELTQVNGGFCPASCQSQAWSTSCTLAALYDAAILR
ncbi:putative Glycogen debranching enzyme [Blattamonas nauphoetae]|uniref:Glycogen debranching enzyme n=1 Tax=Blattamonas nauphoetae TaxID=2049346 RepID=A0ABQ9XQS6_9EUKA|nr:putative Glycogen debranching enzyme [Blattamonas nauphoetae]